MVSRSASNNEQMSCDNSSMISSILVVAWILFVTAWSLFWNSSLWLISARFWPACGLVSNTVLMACVLLPFAGATFRYYPSSRRAVHAAWPVQPYSKLENLPVGKHARVVTFRTFLHFLHRQGTGA